MAQGRDGRMDGRTDDRGLGRIDRPTLRIAGHDSAATFEIIAVHTGLLEWLRPYRRRLCLAADKKSILQISKFMKP